MASSRDESKTNTLPDPELNPLLNPLLAAHMGRWAEVYFTNPPEKRGEAVAELLRELEKTSAAGTTGEPAIELQKTEAETNRVAGEHRAAAVGANWQNDPGFQAPTIEPSALESSTRETSARETFPSESPTSEKPGSEGLAFGPETPKALGYYQSCIACGYVNPPGQFFCGMCGTRLEMSSAGSAPIPDAAAASGSENGSDAVDDQNSIDESFSEDQVSSATGLNSERFEFREPSLPTPEDYIPSFAAASEEPSSKSYRLYVGVAVAVLCAALVYMGWRGSRFLAASTKPATAASDSSAATQTQPEAGSAGQSAVPGSENGKTEAPVPTDSAAAASAPAAVPAGSTPSTSTKSPAGAQASGNHGNDSRRASPVVANAPNSSTDVAEPSGAGDFATAQKYLNGDASTARDTSQAVPWLWRAVGKGNVQAALMLSDLYLRGDGVAKNCDQARVLLDSAARKGGKAAAERLRNLQAYGCQ